MKGPVGNRSMKMPELAARIGSEAFVILVCNVFVVFLSAPRFEGAGRTVPLRALACAFDNLIWPTFDTFIWPTPGS